MKYYIYILTLLLFSCDDLLEHSGPLSYDTLISEGWGHFIDKNYEMAEELFTEVLEIDSSLVPYFSDALVGLGWTNLYHAKELTGSSTENINQRFALRDSANILLLLAYDEMNSYSGNEEIPYNLISDLYAGLSYATSSLVLHDNFIYGEDSDELVYSALDYSDSLLSQTPDYYFLYDSTNINSNNIHLLRAQLYLEIHEYAEAEEEILQIDLISSDVQFNLEHEYDSSIYDLFLYIGFKGQDKHLFEMLSVDDSTYQLQRSFTPVLPCLDLIVDEIDLADNEIVECLTSFPTNILEYKYSLRFPNSINESITNNADCYGAGYDWIDDVGCVDGYMFLMEDFEDSDCLSGGFRIISISESDSLISTSSCYNSCGSCTD